MLAYLAQPSYIWMDYDRVCMGCGMIFSEKQMKNYSDKSDEGYQQSNVWKGINGF